MHDIQRRRLLLRFELVRPNSWNALYSVCPCLRGPGPGFVAALWPWLMPRFARLACLLALLCPSGAEGLGSQDQAGAKSETKRAEGHGQSSVHGDGLAPVKLPAQRLLLPRAAAHRLDRLLVFTCFPPPYTAQHLRSNKSFAWSFHCATPWQDVQCGAVDKVPCSGKLGAAALPGPNRAFDRSRLTVG